MIEQQAPSGWAIVHLGEVASGDMYYVGGAKAAAWLGDSDDIAQYSAYPQHQVGRLISRFSLTIRRYEDPE